MSTMRVMSCTMVCVGWALAGMVHVDTAGSDGGNGTLGAPYLTISKAASVAVPGDTVTVHPGVYRESVRVRRSGQDGAWIVFVAERIHEALVDPTALPDGDNYVKDAFLLDSASYVEISGFDLTAGRNSSGVGADYGHHTRVLNNRIHDCGASGIQLNHGDYRHIEGNEVTRCAFYMSFAGSGISMWQAVAFDDATGPHNVVRGNICHHNDNLPGTALTDGNGIIIDDFRNTQNGSPHGPYKAWTLVENNLCYANGAKGVHVFFTDSVIVRNNTCYLNNTRVDDAWWRAELSAVACSNVRWINNIGVTNSSLQPHNAAILIGNVGAAMSDVIWRNNLTLDLGAPGSSSVFRDGTDAEMPTTANGNRLGVDPGFANPDDADFHVGSSGPAADAGTDAYGLPATDITGAPRVGGTAVDIGAYEGGPTSTRGTRGLVDRDRVSRVFSFTPIGAGLRVGATHTIATPTSAVVIDARGRVGRRP